jgi:hypothetical protein
VKKKASHRKTKPPPEKLPYEQSEEESKAVAQKNLDYWHQRLIESRARRVELQKNPPKPHYIAQRELRKKINEREKMQRDARKPSSLSDYERSLSTSHIRSRGKRREQGKMLHGSGSNLSNLLTR